MSDLAHKALHAVLSSHEWRQMGGLDEDTIYGQLALAVANKAISMEREASAEVLMRGIRELREDVDDLRREVARARPTTEDIG